MVLLGDVDRDFLCRPTAGLAEFHHNHYWRPITVKGMSLMTMPLTAWAWYITSCMSLTAFAVLMPACILVILGRMTRTSFFVPSDGPGHYRQIAAALRKSTFSGSTFSGFSDIPRCTSRLFQAWASFSCSYH